MSGLPKFKRFQTQILLLFLLLVMLPMSALSGYLYDDIVQSAESRLNLQMQSESSQWAASYQARCAQVRTLAYMISNNPTFTNYMTSRPQKDAELIKLIRYSFRPMLEWLITTNEIVYRIHFYTANEYLPEDKYVSQCSRHEGEEWFQEMQREAYAGRMMSAGRARSLPYESDSNYPLVSTYQVQITGAPAAYLQLDIAADWLYDDIPLAVDGRTGEILYSALDPALVGQHLETEALGTDFQHTVELLGEKYYLALWTPEDEQVLFVNLAPAEQVLSQIRVAQQNFLIACLVLAGLTLAMVWVITRHVTRRVDRIGQMVGQIARGQYLVFYASRYNDEIDRLGETVQEMGRKMDRLVNQGLRQSLLTKEAEFRALQAQINPHFIFNTLESFQMLAELEGLKTLSDMMALLGKLVRYNLENTPTVPLRMEIGNVQDYVAVQNLSWNDRIRLELDLDDALMDREVLRLMLQPIVENAVVHGMPEEGNLQIRICIARDDRGLRMQVSNDGNAMTPEEAARLDALLREAVLSPVSAQARRIALQNIQRRLIIQYGRQCLIRVSQEEGKGFLVEFVLPDERRGEPCA